MTERPVDIIRALRDPQTSYTTVHEYLAKLPVEVPAEVAAEAALRLRDDHAWRSFARSAANLPERVIRVMLDRLRAPPAPALAVYLVTAMRDSDSLERDWARALEGLLAMKTAAAWGSKARRAKIAALAKSPLLPAIQAAAVSGPVPTLDLLAVLAADGSDASVDALLSHFHAAIDRQDERLDALARLKTHAAKTEALRLMFASLERSLTQRNQASPALAFARRLGFDVELFSTDWSLSSDVLTSGHVPLYQASVVVDSASSRWFRVTVTRITGLLTHHRTAFEDEGAPALDELGLGRCTPEELPAWFAQAARTLGVVWKVSVGRSTLRGAKRQRALAWMEGSAPEPSNRNAYGQAVTSRKVKSSRPG